MADERPNFLKRVPVTPYDISGYLIPGGLLLISIAGFEAFVRESATTGAENIHTPVYTTIALLVNQAPPGTSWATQAIVLVMAAAIAYSIGHIIASISAIVIDRWYVHKAHGYPSQFLLYLSETEPNYTQLFHRGLFFWVNFYLLLRYFTLPNALPVADFVPRPFKVLIPGALSVTNMEKAAFAVGWMLLVMLIIKVLFSAKYAREGRTIRRLLETKVGKYITAGSAFAILVFAFPAKIVTRFLGNYLHTKDRLDPISAELFKKRLNELVCPDADIEERDKLLRSSSGFWYAFLHIRATSHEVFEPVDNWLRLYAFARNLSTSLYLAAGYCYLWWFNQGADIELRNAGVHYTLLLLPLLYWIAAFLLLLRYYYLYVGYFTKYVLRAFVYLTRNTRSDTVRH